MSPNLVYLALVAVLYAAGVFLLLERSLTRVLLGILMLGNATNLLLLASGGPAGGPPLVGRTPVEDMADPLPQAMVLTAIVISLATIGFLLAMSYRLWQLSGTDDVPDDAEAARILRMAAADETSSTYDPSESPTTTADERAKEDSP